MWRRVLWLLGCLWAVTAAAEFPLSEDLERVGQEARERGVPVLLVFGASDCVYCRRLEAEVLEPMLRDAESLSVVIAEVHIDSEAPLTGFDGRPTSGAALAERYGVSLTPTVFLLAPDGTALGRPLVGYNPSFYEAYLEAAIEAARKRLVESQS